MKRLKLWFRCWNEWRKGNWGDWFHKLLVLFGVVKSPTLSLLYDFESFRDSCQ